ncbi:MAG: hypothetical protein GC193_06140 [Cryomorphaceae bacterium]|nr:hypothetical protein [Cryomorphaceae bacterium]
MTGRFAIISILLTLFLSSYVLFKSPFEGYVTYLFMVIFFPFYISKFGIPALPVVIFTPLLISGLIYIQTLDNTDVLFLKIFLGFFSSVLFYRYVLQAFEYDVSKLFGYYMKGAVVVSAIGLIQIASYQVGFSPGYDFSWILNKWGLSPGGLGIRLNSIVSEPAQFAAVVGPAFFVSAYNLVFRKNHFIKRSSTIIIIIAYSLTFSTLGILGISLTVIILVINYGFLRYVLIVGPILYFGLNYAYDNIDEFRVRFDGVVTTFSDEGEESKNYTDVHGSSFVLYNNYVIASENFKRNPLFGTGLGSHPIAFERFSLTRNARVLQVDFNKADANSMFLRLMSETGLYGLIVMLGIVIRNFVMRRNAVNEENWLISGATVLIILIYLMRQGHYFLNGLPFFIWLYYYTRKRNDKQKAELESPSFGSKTEKESAELQTI